MKKSIALLAVVVAMFFTLTGCGESEKKDNKESKKNDSKEAAKNSSSKATKKNKRHYLECRKWNIPESDPVVEIAKKADKNNFQEILKTHWGISLDIPVKIDEVSLDPDYYGWHEKHMRIKFEVPGNYDYVGYLSKIFEQIKSNAYWEPEQKFKNDAKLEDYLYLSTRPEPGSFSENMPNDKLDEFLNIKDKEKEFVIGPVVYCLKEKDMNTSRRLLARFTYKPRASFFRIDLIFTCRFEVAMPE